MNDKSINAYIASETFKNVAEGILRSMLDFLNLGVLEKYIDDDLMDKIDQAYEENYYHTMDQAFQKYPELTKELASATRVRKGKDIVESPTELGAALIAELCTTITVYQAVIKMLMHHTNILED